MKPALLTLLLLPALASANVKWRGDFETGDRSQYSSAELVSADRLQVVTTTVRQGAFALRATVKLGDDPINASGNRNELVKDTGETEGDEYYYGFSTYFPDAFPSSPYYQLFVQWHHDGCCGSPPLSFWVQNDQYRLQIGGDSGRVVYTAPFVRSVWSDWVLHVKWSSDAQVGFVELYQNREKVLSKTYGQTMFAGMTNYLKLGLYRDERVTADATMFHDNFVWGTTLEDVMPPAVVIDPTPDAGTPPGTRAGCGDDPDSDSGAGRGHRAPLPYPLPISDGGTPITTPPTIEGAPRVGCSTAGGAPMGLAVAGLTLASLIGRRRRSSKR